MPEARCFYCNMEFEYNSNDYRPYIYHEHDDGVSAGIRNPNFWSKSKKGVFPAQIKTKPK